MKKLKKPGKKVICIVAAVFVVVVGGIIALVLHMNREVAPWDNLSASSTPEDVHEIYGEPHSSQANDRGTIDSERYDPYEFLGMSGWTICHYAYGNKISSISWYYALPDGKALNDAEDEIEKIQEYLKKEFGEPENSTEEFWGHSVTWHDLAGKEITFRKTEAMGEPSDKEYSSATLCIQYVFTEVY